MALRSRKVAAVCKIPYKIALNFEYQPFKQLNVSIPRRTLPVKQLINHLLANLILDFQGDLTLDMVRDFLRDDESREGRALLAKLVEDRGVSDMMITLADCLQDYIRTGISEETLRDQIRTYAES
jgi:hypothetical protein